MFGLVSEALLVENSIVRSFADEDWSQNECQESRGLSIAATFLSTASMHKIYEKD